MSDVLRWFHPLLKGSLLGSTPRRVQVNGEAYALFRDADGKPAAVADACPHRFAPLSSGKVRADGRLQCPYHGWHFDAEGRGVSPSNATHAKCDTRALRVEEKYGWLWACSRGGDAQSSAVRRGAESAAESGAGATQSPRGPNSQETVPELERDGYRFTGAFSMLMPAPLHVALDNFSENEHVPFVHTRLGWSEADVQSIEFEAENRDDSTVVKYGAPQRWSPLLWLFDLKRGDRYHNNWVTRFDPVRTEYEICWTSRDGAQRPFLTRSTIFMVPETPRTTWFHVFITTRLDKSYPLRGWMFRLAALALGWWEVRDDARFLPLVADVTPPGRLTGKLGKFDKPLIHNRKLLERYYGEESAPSSSSPSLRVVP